LLQVLDDIDNNGTGIILSGLYDFATAENDDVLNGDLSGDGDRGGGEGSTGAYNQGPWKGAVIVDVIDSWRNWSTIYKYTTKAGILVELDDAMWKNEMQLNALYNSGKFVTVPWEKVRS
jgi:hypothetical protein